MKRKLYWLSVIVFALAGCSLLPEKPPATPPVPTPEKALVYLLRSPIIAGHLWQTTFKIDGKPITSLYDKEYSWLYLAPGQHTFSAEFNREADLVFVSGIDAGKTYYIEFTQEIIGNNRIRNLLQQIPPHQGSEMTATYTYRQTDQPIP